MAFPPVAFSFSNAAFEPDWLLVSRFAGKEALSRLFRFDIDLGSLQKDVPFGDLINKPATLTLTEGSQPIKIHGLVADFEQRGFREDMAMYRAVLVPRAWVLTLSYQSRIFLNMSVREVIEQVLRDHRLPTSSYRFELKQTYEQRDYIAQFQETDWNFVCRWMEHLGIFFYFEHGAEEEVLVISDDSSQCKEAAIDDGILFRPDSGALSDSEGKPTIHDIALRERVGTGEVVLNDYNYREPNNDLQAKAKANQDMPGTHYEYGGHYLKGKEGDRLAKVRGEELASDRRALSGQSNIVPFRSGYTFKLDLDPAYRSDLNISWLLTHVDHFGTQESGLATAQGLEGATYRNTFRSIPASTPYRPPRLTPVPRPSLMTAVAETAGGDYAHLDEEGRYHAKLHFDLGPKDKGTASLPIRMTQPYSGKDYGIHFPVHADAELVLAFINGNIDQPIALGTAPNPNTKSPTTSGNKTENVIRTQGGNELVFDDTKDKQRILLKTKTGHLLQFEDEHDTLMLQSSDKNQTVTIDMKNKKIVLDNKNGDIEMKAINIKLEAAKNFELKANKNIELDAEMNTALKSGMNHSIESGMDVNIKADMNVSIEASMNASLEGSMNVKTKGGVQNSVEGGAMTEVKGALVKIN